MIYVHVCVYVYVFVYIQLQWCTTRLAIKLSSQIIFLFIWLHLQRERESEEQVEKAVEILETVSKQDRDEMAQAHQRALAASQDYVNTTSSKLESLMTHNQRQGNAKLEEFSREMESNLAKMKCSLQKYDDQMTAKMDEV